MTTGGTESIFLAVKAARDSAARPAPRHRRDRTSCSPLSAHPAFDKAAHFLGLDTVRTPLAADFRADPAAIAAAITAEHGDGRRLRARLPARRDGPDRRGRGARAPTRELWMHVDACVGGYIAPFARKLGAPIEPFDFAVPGVRSISADLHKYGYAAKGASTLFFADAASFAGMGYAFDNWPRGQYMTNTLVGTRAGGAIAAAWAVMNYLGEEGYLRITRRVLDDARRPTSAASRRSASAPRPARALDPRLRLDRHDIAAVGQAMTRRGWLTGYVKNPPGLHLMLNLTHEPVVGEPGRPGGVAPGGRGDGAARSSVY